jgi:hypothetical protein
MSLIKRLTVLFAFLLCNPTLLVTPTEEKTKVNFRGKQYDAKVIFQDDGRVVLQFQGPSITSPYKFNLGKYQLDDLAKELQKANTGDLLTNPMGNDPTELAVFGGWDATVFDINTTPQSTFFSRKYVVKVLAPALRTEFGPPLPNSPLTLRTTKPLTELSPAAKSTPFPKSFKDQTFGLARVSEVRTTDKGVPFRENLPVKVIKGPGGIAYFLLPNDYFELTKREGGAMSARLYPLPFSALKLDLYLNDSTQISPEALVRLNKGTQISTADGNTRVLALPINVTVREGDSRPLETILEEALQENRLVGDAVMAFERVGLANMHTIHKCADDMRRLN